MFSMKANKKSGFGSVYFMVLALGVVLALMAYLKADMKKLKQPAAPRFAEEIKVVDKTYFNKPMNFCISMPNSDWEMTCVDNVDSLATQDVSKTILENIYVLAEMYRRDGADTLALVQMGVMPLAEPRTPQSLAMQNFAEISQSFSAPDTVRVIQPVVLTTFGKLRGAYYMVEFPESVRYSYPVWLAMFVVYSKTSYSIICQVRSEDYEFLRTDLEKILESFHPLNIKRL
ncbi:MAG: hypothetical protein ACOY90_00830 [Candidatus Zhuqueibacterota bacterium]